MADHGPALARRRRHLPRRRTLIAAAAAALAALVVTAMLSTSYDEQRLAYVDGPMAVPVAPWSRPCWRRNQRWHRTYTLRCARVRGRVLYRQGRDPDGDGDAHLLVVAGHRLAVVKFTAQTRPRRLPGPGGTVSAVGLLSSGRFGVAEVTVERHRRR